MGALSVAMLHRSFPLRSVDSVPSTGAEPRGVAGNRADMRPVRHVASVPGTAAAGDVRQQLLVRGVARLQFNQLTPYKVFHPIEILKETYANHRT